MEKFTKTNCDYCGEDWGLRAELIDNIEALYNEFIKGTIYTS